MSPSKITLTSKNRITWILRIVVGGLFVLAGLLKMAEPREFMEVLLTHGILGSGGVLWVARILPFMEVFTGLMILVGWPPRMPWLAASCMYLVFTGVVCVAIIRGIPVDCGCFVKAPPSHLTLALVLFRNLTLLPLCLWMYQGTLAEGKIRIEETS